MFSGRSQTCWLEPACIVTPNSAPEVSIIIQVISALETKFAIRSGGHKPTPGFNSVGSDGILIALQNLNSLSISADKNTMTVGTGARWRDAYVFARDHGKILVGGREPMVGVGGFLLGGPFLPLPSLRPLDIPTTEADINPEQVASASSSTPGASP